MKYKTLFRMLLKAVGVLLVVQGATQGITSLSYLLLSLVPNSPVSSGPFPYVLAQLLSPFVQAGAGLYLFLDGKWVADKAIPGNRPYCNECGYDLTGATGNVCVECGTPFRAAATDAMGG